MKGLDHRKKAKKHRNGRSMYEKGRRLYHICIRNPLKRVKGDRKHRQHNPEPVKTTLGDVWPE